MKIFIDICHPADVHFFRNFIELMKNRGHSFFITARNKDCTFDLLDFYNIPYVSRGKGSGNTAGRIFYMLNTVRRLINLEKNYRPDLLLAFASPYLAQVSRLTGIPGITVNDTESGSLPDRLTYPYVEAVLTPECNYKDIGDKKIKFRGYKEISCLHPNYFRPDKEIYSLLGLKQNEKYILVRWVSRNVFHDRGKSGMSVKQKERIIEEFSKYARVFVSSETELNHRMLPFKINIPAEKMHDVLAHSTLLFGESATMAAEASVLGRPAIFMDNTGRGYITDMEKKYGIVSHYNITEENMITAMEKCIGLIASFDENSCNAMRKRIIADNIDVTAFLVWFIENFPESKSIMQDNPDYQNIFY
ncbi:DUF354 domain-containing protein [Patescibacteria group bacterium]|nr:DUF354 domain-containing protein [Patescibacteria group bacterium]